MNHSSPSTVGLIVPVFDEAVRAPEFIEELVAFVRTLPAGSQLLVVDDGSTDGTGDLVEQALEQHGDLATVLRRPHLGKGAAVAAGLRTMSQPILAFCDVDLSTSLDDLRRIIDAAGRPNALAIGSRDLSGSRLTRPEGRVREALGRAYNRLLQATVVPGVVDTQCGAKAARAEVWAEVLPWCGEEGFAWDAEVVAVASARGMDVQELPVTWSHDARSKVRVGHDGLAMVWATPRIWRSRRAARASAGPRVSEVFAADNADLLISADRDHWWFRSKASLVATALRRSGGAPHGDWLVDVGGGAGGVTALLGWPASSSLSVDGNEELVRSAHRAHGLPGARALTAALPLRGEAVAVVCLLDVIEHLDDPVSTLREARRSLRPDGRLVVMVPAHPWLWSSYDEELGHRRRYTRRALRADLRAAGFAPAYLTHVFSWLVLPAWLTRRARRAPSVEAQLATASVAVDRASLLLTWMERQLIGRVSVPVGTSILCVAVKA